MDELPANVDLQRPDRPLLLWAYANGVFPMADPRTRCLEWFCPDPRAIIPLDDGFHVPRTLARAVRQGRLDIRSDTCFERVIRACAEPRSADDLAWIDDRIVGAYVELHRHGDAHSVEAWLEGELVGGLYGVHLGGAFFGESMFSRPDLGGSNASKVCLVHLVEHMRARGMTLLDTQFRNEHLDQFGCLEIRAAEYTRRLREALSLDIGWGWPA